jgi:hypothetical protein
MKRVLTVLVLFISVLKAFGYPITPQTLRKLIEYSPYIVIATVDNPEKPEKFYDQKTKDSVQVFSFGGDGVATLNIKEVLKGQPGDVGEIEVEYEAGMICPSPANYPDKKLVIAFLAKEDTSKRYYTVGLSYGSKIMGSEKEMLAFKKRILDYLEIEKIKNKRKRKSATVEWLVKCVEDKFTRWEGAYDLSREGDFMSYYDYSKDNRFYKSLKKSQKHRLDSCFFATDTLDFSELCLANLMSKKKYPQLKQHFLKSLTLSDFYIAKDIMKKIIEISPNEKLQLIVKEVEDSSFNDDSESERRRIIDEFISVANRQ